MKLPEFGPKVELFDVEGIPVSLGNVPGVPISAAAWDVDPPRPFDPESARRNGAPLYGPSGLAEFQRLIVSARAGRSAAAGSSGRHGADDHGPSGAKP